jgi:hypothetical protein
VPNADFHTCAYVALSVSRGRGTWRLRGACPGVSQVLGWAAHWGTVALLDSDPFPWIRWELCSLTAV